MSCPTPTKLDLTQLPCIEVCRQLYAAYMRMLMGGQKTLVRHGDYSVEYRANSSADLEKLKAQYETLRSQCPDAMKALPSLVAGAGTRRSFTMGRSEHIPGGINRTRGRY